MLPKTHNLTCVVQHLNSKKVVRSKILIQNVVFQQILTNSTMKLSPRAVNRGDVLTACFRDIQSQRSIRMEFNYYDFIRREGLSLPI